MITQKEMLAHFSPILETKGTTYKKKSLVRAKRATKGAVIVTKTSDGVETQNTAGDGDWLVENQTSSSEQYLVKSSTFRKKYKMLYSLKDGWGCYQPKGEVVGYQIKRSDLEVFKLGDVLEFEAPWKDSMILREGDYLVIPTEKVEIYRIAKKEFGETYDKL